MAETALVITSISAPNAALKSYAEGCVRNGWEFIVIGDAASPKDFDLLGCHFFSLHQQYEMPFQLAQILPVKHYARKNLGYLQAIKNGAQIIVETDDDNLPYPEFWLGRSRKFEAVLCSEKGWYNTYSWFTQERIWPRGFPLDEVQKIKPIQDIAHHDLLCPVQQGLADENPDVDAVYRLVFPLPLKFNQNTPLALNEGVWCPFNSQNTSWFKEAFPLLYLPTYCSFRMTDIWRSFVVQRVLWTCNYNMLFHNATVWQERNEHNLVKDFEQEIPGYINNTNICRILEELPLNNGVKNIPDNMLKCYQAFIAENLIGSEEITLLDAWLNDIYKLI